MKKKTSPEDKLKYTNRAVELMYDTSVDDMKVESMEAEAMDELQHTMLDSLYRSAAKGNSTSLLRLLRLANTTIQHIDELTKSNFLAVHEIAKTQKDWPALIMPNPTSYKQIKLHLMKLGVGTIISSGPDLNRAVRELKLPKLIALRLVELIDISRNLCMHMMSHKLAESAIETASKSTSPKAKPLVDFNKEICRRLTSKEFQCMEKIQTIMKDLDSTINVSCNSSADLLSTLVSRTIVQTLNLEPLTHEDLDDWFAIGKQIIMSLTNQHPEKNSMLRQFGAYRKDAYYRKDTNPGQEFEKRRKSAKATEEANIRDGIFQRIKSGFEAIMPKKQPEVV
jgi:hypothetical protein